MSIHHEAEAFATAAHRGQFRDGGEPYIEHPRRVFEAIYFAGLSDDEVFAMAYLHDVVEDCGVTKPALRSKFGDRVADGVMELTNLQARGTPFLVKHSRLLEHAASMSTHVKWVKLADRLDNLTSARKVWELPRLARYARASFELVQALMPWPIGAEKMATDILHQAYLVLPMEELRIYRIR